MIRIVDSTQVGKLLARKAARFAEAEATCGRSSRTSASAAIKRCSSTRASSTTSTASRRRVPEAELKAAAAQLSPDVSQGGRRRHRRTSAHSRSCRCRRRRRATISPGIRGRTDRAAARRRRGIHPRRPLSPALDADDDGDSGAGRGRAEHLRHVAAASAGDPRDGVAARSRAMCFCSAARTPSRRSRMERRPFRARIASSARATSMSRRRRSCSPAKSASTSSPDPPRF